jgi:predicted DNA-binding transcriptional regulator AlpA
MMIEINQNTTEQKAYTINQMMKKLNLSRTTIWRKIKKKKLHAENIGTDEHPIWRFPHSKVSHLF